jgi:hypothetical protein
MPNIITIPTPCHENWDTMTPNDKGRHCDSCAKTVIDFTHWKTTDIVVTLQNSKNICGRFTNTQLDVPIPTSEDFVKQIAYFKMSTLKKIAAIFLFVFMVGGSSCNENQQLTGQIVSKKIDPIDQSRYVGEPVAINVIDSPPSLQHPIIKTPNIPITTKGKIALVKKPLQMGAPKCMDTKSLNKDSIVKIGTTVGAVEFVTPVTEEPLMGKVIFNKIDSTKK